MNSCKSYLVLGIFIVFLSSCKKDPLFNVGNKLVLVKNANDSESFKYVSHPFYVYGGVTHNVCVYIVRIRCPSMSQKT